MLIINEAYARRLKSRFEKIESDHDRDIAAFMLSVMTPEDPQRMWKKHEIYKAGGEMAFRGFYKLTALELAAHWPIDNLYAIAAELYLLDIEKIAMAAFGYEIKATEDGGFWLYHGYHQVEYYRREGMAKRRALKEIRKEIEGAK